MKTLVLILTFTASVYGTVPKSPASYDYLWKYAQIGANFLKNKTEAFLEDTGVANTDCVRHLKLLLRDVFQRKKWAIEMIDATSKLDAGLLAGNLNMLGNYDQCLGIEEQIDDTNIKGQYCTVTSIPKNDSRRDFQFILNVSSAANLSSRNDLPTERIMGLAKLTHGVCLPSSCSIDSLETVWKSIEYTFNPSFDMEFLHYMCDYKGKPLFETGIEGYVYIGFTIWLSFLLFCTLYDIFRYHNDDQSFGSYLVACSVYNNGKKLFETDAGENNISCINGLKVMSILWVIIGHRFILNIVAPNRNFLSIFQWKDEIKSMFVMGSTISVDTFITLSGLLLSYIYLRISVTKEIKINLASFYLLRLCRILPTLFATIMIYIVFFKYMNSGPSWIFISGKMAQDCVNYGWMNMLFINNLLDLGNQCLAQSWYIAVDSQLYFLFPILFYGFRINTRKAFVMMFLLGLSCSAYTFFTTFKYNTGTDFLGILGMYLNQTYQSIFGKVAGWLIGVAAGYLVFYYKDKELKISKELNLFLWTCSILAIFSVIFGQVVIFRNYTKNSLALAVFNAFIRPIWSFIISGIVFGCASGHGGYINSFLSLPVFNVLAKLTYSMFLTHFAVLMIIIGGGRHIDHFSNLRGIHEFFGDAVFCFAVAVPFTLFFESPVISIGKKIFLKYAESVKKENFNHTKVITKYIFWILPYSQVYKREKEDKLE